MSEIRPIGEAFNATIDYYDGWMRTALPGFDALFGTAVELVPYPRNAAIEVLDLGAGSGLFSKHVLDAFPNARFTLLDLADRLLEVARLRFAGNDDQFEYRVGDYRRLGESDGADAAPIEADRSFDLVISSLSIHHLEHDEKRALFRRVWELLRPGGAFINIDQVRAETEPLRQLYWTHWLEQVRRNGAPEDQIAQSIERRTTYDRDASLAEQLTWLTEAGFVDPDAVYKNYFVAVFYARKMETGTE